MLSRDSEHDEIEIVISSTYLNLFEPNEPEKIYQKAEKTFFLFEIEDRKKFMSEIKYFL